MYVIQSLYVLSLLVIAVVVLINSCKKSGSWYEASRYIGRDVAVIVIIAFGIQLVLVFSVFSDMLLLRCAVLLSVAIGWSAAVLTYRTYVQR